MLPSSTIPIVDLSPFTDLVADQEGRKKAIEAITSACTGHGFFQIVNHGVPVSLIAQALEVSEEFFRQPEEEKVALSSGEPLPVGYGRQPIVSSDKNEFFLMVNPDSSIPNNYPRNLPQFRRVLEELFSSFGKTGLLVESLLNECLGLPPNFLREYSRDRSCDFMSTKHYFPATSDEDSVGLSEHEDGNCFTFVIQDDVGGLEVKKDGVWVPLVGKEEGTIVVNIGDVIQVLSNNKFKSATHRVLRSQGRSRYSYAFFYNLPGEKWIEPLAHFTRDIGESPKYRGFMYKEYQRLRFRNKTHPPSTPQDAVNIRHYAITTA